MKLRLYNGKILTMQQGSELIDGEVWVEEGKISYIGPEKAGERFSREIDLEGDLVMPSFKNAHTHSAMTFLRSYADDLPLQQWLSESIFPMEAQLKEQDVYDLARLAFLEYLTSGITACMDMYFFPHAMAKAAADCSFRTVMVGAVNDFSESVELLEQYYNQYHCYSPFVSYELGFHAEYTTAKKTMEQIAALSQKYKAPVFTHSSETELEVQECIGRYGVTPTALFEQLDLMEHGGGIYHGVWLSEEDLQRLARKKFWVITNPASNAKLASGIAPLQALLAHKIPVALGTDGPASNNALDMFREMYLAAVLAKLREKDAQAVPAEDILQMATVGGARVMGLADCDCLAPGKQADLIVVTLQKPNMQPVNDIIKNIVYSGTKDNVVLTMVGGKILYENGRFPYFDAKEIYTKANRIIERMR